VSSSCHRLGAAALLLLAAPATAQEAITLPEIVTTARRLEETAREVPFSLSVLDGRQIEDRRIDRIEDLVGTIPNFGVAGFGERRSSFPLIRGLGALVQPLAPDDSSVVTYVDGVPQPLFGSNLAYLDIERVEVLRGPQGTLFGRNAQAGAINIVTRRPNAEREFLLRQEFGEDGYNRTEAIASGALLPDRLFGRLALRWAAVDGYVGNELGREGGRERNFAGRGTLVGRLGADTTLTFSFNGEVARDRPTGFVLRGTAGYPRVASTGYTADRDVWALTANLEHRLSWAVLTSLTGYTNVRTFLNTDDDEGFTYGRVFGLPRSAFARPNVELSRFTDRDWTLSQELRLNSLPDSAVTWVAGLSYVHNGFETGYVSRSAFFGSTNGTRSNSITTDNVAGFGEVTVPLGTTGFRLTTGLRLSHEEKSWDATFRGNGFPGTVAFFRETGSRSYDFATGRIALSYDWNADHTSYATIARGYKTGGFPRFANDAYLGVASEPYRPSTSWTYEIGHKMRLWNGRLQLDVAAFHNDVRNEHLQAVDFNSFSFRPFNLDMRSTGAEAQAAVALAPGLTATAGLGFTHAELVDVPANLALSGGARSGNRPPNVPRFNTNLGLAWRTSAAPLGLPDGWMLSVQGNHQFVSGRYGDIANTLRLGQYQLVNLRIGIERNGAEFYVFANNLFDARFETAGLDYGRGAEVVVPGRGRLVGAGAAVRF
jgi:iron complex outermembrane receptor protein